MTAPPAASRRLLARELLDRDAEFVRVHAVDDGVSLGVELLLDRGHMGAMDQSLGDGQCCRRVLRQAMRQFAGRGFSSAAGTILATRPQS
jgi:hypothetical protein